MAAANDTASTSNTYLSEELLQEAGITIFRHETDGKFIGHEKALPFLKHDWSAFLAKELLTFKHIITQEYEASLDENEQKAVRIDRPDRIITKARPSLSRYDDDYLKEFPDAGIAAIERRETRATKFVKEAKKRRFENEGAWLQFFSKLLEDLGETVDGNEISIARPAWFQKLNTVNIEVGPNWICGQKELESNRLLNAASGQLQLTRPRPDICISFSVQVGGESQERNEAESLQDKTQIIPSPLKDPLRDNFSYHSLNTIAEYISSKSKFEGFCPALTQDIRKQASSAKNTFNLACFPWFICELKNGKVDRREERRVVLHAANGCAVALKILSKLSQRGHKEPVIREVRPVFALTSQGSEVFIWVAYVSKMNVDFLHFEMHKIWHGSLFDHLDMMELSLFLDRLHYWAIHSLRPWISSCLDHWQHLMVLDTWKESIEAHDTSNIDHAIDLNDTSTVDQNANAQRKSSKSALQNSPALSTPVNLPKRAVSTGSILKEVSATEDDLYELASAKKMFRFNGDTVYRFRPDLFKFQNSSTKRTYVHGPQDTFSPQSSRAASTPDLAGATVTQSRPAAFIGELNIDAQSPFSPLPQPKLVSHHSEGCIATKGQNHARDESSNTTKETITSDSSVRPKAPFAFTFGSSNGDMSNTRQLGDLFRKDETEKSPEVSASGELFTISHRSSQYWETHLYNQTEFQNVLKNGNELLRNVEDVLGKIHSERGSITERYINEAVKISPSRSFNRHTIALLGTGGVGKSSLVNSLLGIPDLAPSSSSGNAVTSFAMEFLAQSDPNGANFKLEIEYQTEEERKTTLKELVADYRHLNDKDLKDEESMLDQNIKNRMESAVSALSTLFGDYPEWETLCKSTGENAYDMAVSQLISWNEDLSLPTENESVWNFGSSSDCCEKLNGLMQSNLWPLIKIGRVYTKSKTLDEGLVLLDLPGLRDTNAARAQITEKHILRADHVFVVSSMARDLKDRSVQADIKSVVALHGRTGKETGSSTLPKATLVCTKSDDFVIQEVMSEKRLEQPILLILKALGQEIEAATNERDQEAIARLELTRRALCVKARNAYLKKEMQHQYDKLLNIEVFCVSNKKYQEHPNGDEHDTSEILQLQRYCSNLVLDDRFHNARDFLFCMIPGLLATMRIWLNQFIITEALIRPRLIAQIHKVSGRLTAALETCEKELETTWNKVVIDEMKLFVPLLDETACKLVLKWKKDLMFKTHLACCSRNGGFHLGQSHGKRKGYHWNEELLAEMNEEFYESWCDAEQMSLKASEHVAYEIQEGLNSLRDLIQDDSSDDLSKRMKSALVKTITKLDRRAQQELSETKTGFTKDLRSLRVRAFNDYSSTSYLQEVMQPTYHKAMECEQGTYRYERQHMCIKRSVGKGIFQKVVERINEAISKMLDAHKTSIEAIIDDITQDLREIVVESQDTVSTKSNLHKSNVILYTTLEHHLEDWELQSKEIAKLVEHWTEE